MSVQGRYWNPGIKERDRLKWSAGGMVQGVTEGQGNAVEDLSPVQAYRPGTKKKTEPKERNGG